ncbi:MAG: hypothetical protein Q9169_006627 [Polycauliona sp. 2 TL-2023]
MSLGQVAFKSAIEASPILLLIPLGIAFHYQLKQIKMIKKELKLGTELQASLGKKLREQKPMTAKTFKIKKEEIKKDMRDRPEHWYMQEDANKENFEDYWGYLFSGFEASRGHRHKYGEPLAMEVSPVFDEQSPGKLSRIIITFVFTEGEEEGGVWREISIEVPTEEDWSRQAWKECIVHIREYDGFTVVLEVGDFESSDLKAFRTAVNDLMELLEL